MTDNNASSRKLTRAESARINGAKSRGPKTAVGKARASQNARRHGLYAAASLPGEDHPDFAPWLESMLASDPEAGPAARNCLHQIALLSFQKRYCWALERQIIEDGIPRVRQQYPQLDSHMLTALSYQANGFAIDMVGRIDARLSRQLATVYRLWAEIGKRGNEPKPPKNSTSLAVLARAASAT